VSNFDAIVTLVRIYFYGTLWVFIWQRATVIVPIFKDWWRRWPGWVRGAYVATFLLLLGLLILGELLGV
jgi:hypothetical protein